MIMEAISVNSHQLLLEIGQKENRENVTVLDFSVSRVVSRL
jgi:hypothetical protein